LPERVGVPGQVELNEPLIVDEGGIQQGIHVHPTSGPQARPGDRKFFR
jgi:hypothetical protein